MNIIRLTLSPLATNCYIVPVGGGSRKQAQPVFPRPEETRLEPDLPGPWPGFLEHIPVGSVLDRNHHATELPPAREGIDHDRLPVQMQGQVIAQMVVTQLLQHLP